MRTKTPIAHANHPIVTVKGTENNLDRKLTWKGTVEAIENGDHHSKGSSMDLPHLLMKDEASLTLEHRLHHHLVSGLSRHLLVAYWPFEQTTRLTVRGKKEEVFW